MYAKILLHLPVYGGEKFNYASPLLWIHEVCPSINFETKSDFANCRTSEAKLSGERRHLPHARRDAINPPLVEFHGFSVNSVSNGSQSSLRRVCKETSEQTVPGTPMIDSIVPGLSFYIRANNFQKEHEEESKESREIPVCISSGAWLIGSRPCISLLRTRAKLHTDERRPLYRSASGYLVCNSWNFHYVINNYYCRCLALRITLGEIFSRRLALLTKAKFADDVRRAWNNLLLTRRRQSIEICKTIARGLFLNADVISAYKWWRISRFSSSDVFLISSFITVTDLHFCDCSFEGYKLPEIR